MALRTMRERIAQTAIFEAIGLLTVVPLYALLFDRGAGEAATNLVLLTAAVLIFSPLHNAAFDRIELTLSGRTACQRPAGWRIVHALSHEVSLLVVTVPLLLGVGGHTLAEVLAINLGLTVFYIAWTAMFHLGWDRLRPVAAQASANMAGPMTIQTPRLAAPCAP